MVINGVELLRKIANNEFKSGQKIRDERIRIEFIYTFDDDEKELTFFEIDDDGSICHPLQTYYTIPELAITKFEILSEEDEDFIEAAIQTLKQQEGKTYTFFKNENEENPLYKYSWCQRPTESNMSLRKFCENGEIIGYMSESLAKEKGLIQVDLNEFIHKFVKPLVKENLKLKQEKQEDEEIDIEAIEEPELGRHMVNLEDAIYVISQNEKDISILKKAVKQLNKQLNKKVGNKDE